MSIKLKIPEELLQLIELGVWPTQKNANSQHSKLLISQEKLKQIAPDEKELYFYPPPFKTIQENLATMKDYWVEYGALDQIDPDLSVVIADFGIGSDTCLILDYRNNIEEPSVQRLVWSQNNYWEKVADNFAIFCTITGLIDKK